MTKRTKYANAVLCAPMIGSLSRAMILLPDMRGNKKSSNPMGLPPQRRLYALASIIAAISSATISRAASRKASRFLAVNIPPEKSARVRKSHADMATMQTIPVSGFQKMEAAPKSPSPAMQARVSGPFPSAQKRTAETTAPKNTL